MSLLSEVSKEGKVVISVAAVAEGIGEKWVGGAGRGIAATDIDTRGDSNCGDAEGWHRRTEKIEEGWEGDPAHWYDLFDGRKRETLQV